MNVSKKTIKFIQHAVNLVVRSEQKHHDYSLSEIAEDGDAGPQTLASIRKMLKIDATWNNQRTLVAAIQTLCTRQGIDVGTVDGYWGSMTDYGFDRLRNKEEKGEDLPEWRTEAEGSKDESQKWPLEQEAELVKFYGGVGKNQTRIDLPYPMKLAWDTNTTVTRMTCHEKVADSVLNALTKVLEHYGQEEIERLGLDLFGGCLNVRKIRGGSHYSTHSWGISLDFDPARNKLKWKKDRANFAKPEYDMWWKCWEDEGAVSLGREHNFDWMHVQFARRK